MYFVVGIYKERGFALNPVSNIGLIQTERETSRSHHPCVQNHPPPLQKISGREDWKKIKIREMAAYPAREIILSCAPLISGEFIQLLSGHLVWLEHYFSLKNYANSVMLFGATKPYLIRLNARSGVMTIYY